MSIPTTSPKEVSVPKPRMIPRASRASATEAVVLADGTRLRFRPLGSEDRDRLAGLFARLTFESRRRRFLLPKPELTPRELAFLTDIDHVTHEAIAAVDQRDGSIVGVARYVGVTDRTGVADLATSPGNSRIWTLVGDLPDEWATVIVGVCRLGAPIATPLSAFSRRK